MSISKGSKPKYKVENKRYSKKKQKKNRWVKRKVNFKN